MTIPIIGTAYSWKYKSFEEADAEQVNGTWKFTAVRHVSAAYASESGSLPPCFNTEVQMNNATGNLENGGSKATMDLDCNLKLINTCCPICPNVVKSVTASHPWYCKQ